MTPLTPSSAPLVSASADAAPRLPGTLYLVCGKIAAGKSTLMQRLASQPHTVLVSEDVWLSRLYPGEVKAIADYVRCTGRLRAALADHLVAVLRAGTSVVLDFPANTPATRAWMRGLFKAASAPHVLHHLDVSDEVCKARLRARNAAGEHPFQTSDAEFDAITQHFTPPADEEGFHVVVHGR